MRGLSHIKKKIMNGAESLLDSVGFVFVFLFAKPARAIGKSTTFNTWIIQQLTDPHEIGKEMVIVAGELGLGIDNPDVINAFEHASRKGKKVKVFCGPKIYYEKDHPNKLYDLISENKYKNFTLIPSTLENYPYHHFVCNGRNVAIETPHLPSEALSSKPQVYVYSDSIFWYNRLKGVFRGLKSNVADSTVKLCLATKEDLITFENSPAFKKHQNDLINYTNN